MANIEFIENIVTLGYSMTLGVFINIKPNNHYTILKQLKILLYIVRNES